MEKIRVTKQTSRTGRRDFLKRAAGAVAVALPYIISRSAPAQGEGGMARDAVTGKLRTAITKLLDELEEKTALKVEFRPLDQKAGVVAQYSFEQPKRPVVHLRGDWEDVDVAHELMHMRLELVEGFTVLAWRKNVERGKIVEKAFGLIRSYTDDILVFDRLGRMGLRVDGEIIKHQFFDDICTKVPKYLKAGKPLEHDGMAHLDNVAEGRYGDLRRSAFLVQAELFKKAYAEKLTDKHNRLLEDFIATFRTHRADQATKADKVLRFFDKHNIEDIKGHARILTGWAALEELDTSVGVSAYVRRDDGFALPFPSYYKTMKHHHEA